MKLHRQLALFIILIIIISPIRAFSQTGLSPGKLALADNELVTKAREEGSVMVIVGLNVDFQPEGNIPLAHAARQRTNIDYAQDSILKELSSQNLERVIRYEATPYLALRVDTAGLERLAASPWVKSIQEDEWVYPTLSESGPLIGAQAAWTSGYTGVGQVVAILDTGVDNDHPFLSGKVVSEACYSNGGGGGVSVCPGGINSTAPESGENCSLSVYGCDHGTHVAGIAAGKGTSFSGVAKDANIIAIQVFTRFNNTINCSPAPTPCVGAYISDIKLGLERVYALRSTYNIAAVNLSLGGGKYSSYCDSDTRKADIDNLRSVGIATVIASGNDYYTDGIGAPACISTAISVGSTRDGGSGATPVNTVSDFSNSASILNLLAPGDRINSSVPGSGYNSWEGTSMATPHVTGAWAVLKSKDPTASVTDIYNALSNTGIQVTDSRNGITKPRIKIDSALALIGVTYGDTAYLPLIVKEGTQSGETSIPNGDFEQGHVAWTESSSNGYEIILESGDLDVSPHGGSWAAWLGGDDYESSYIQQSVTINSATPYLAYYHYIDSSDACGYDYARIFANGSTVHQYNLCASENTGGWEFYVVDLGAYAGQTVSLQISATTDGSYSSSLFIDDVGFQSTTSTFKTPVTTRALIPSGFFMKKNHLPQGQK